MTSLINHIQKLTELSVEPFECRRFGWLVIGMGELLYGELLEILSDNLLGQVVIKDVVIDRHPEIAVMFEGRIQVLIFGLEDFIQRIGEYVQRGERHSKRVFIFQDSPVHLAHFAERVGERSLQARRVHHVVRAS